LPDAESPQPSAANGAAPFEALFDTEFERLRRQRGANLVKLSGLREALSQFAPEQFEQELSRLRRQNRYVLQSFDGRHGDLSEEDRAAAIVEADRTFVYAARRDHD
jgi:hypothetical protein